jgi:hypothetical protein
MSQSLSICTRIVWCSQSSSQDRVTSNRFQRDKSFRKLGTSKNRSIGATDAWIFGAIRARNCLSRRIQVTMMTMAIKYTIYLLLFSRKVLLWWSDNQSCRVKIFSQRYSIVLFRIMSLKLMWKFTESHEHSSHHSTASQANSKSQWIATRCCWIKSQPRSVTNHQIINVAWSCL